MSNAPSIDRQVSLIALVAFAGCYKAILPEIVTPSRVEGVGASAEWTASIATIIRNSSRDTIQLSWQPILQQRAANGWRTVDMVATAANGRDPIRQVGPHDSLSIEIVKEDSRDMRALLRRGPLETGEYRLQFDWWRFRHGKQSRFQYAASNGFVIVVPEPDAKRDVENLFDALTAKVLDDLKIDWLHHVHLN